MGALLLNIAKTDPQEYARTADRPADREPSMAQAEGGEFATAHEIAAMCKKFV